MSGNVTRVQSNRLAHQLHRQFVAAGLMGGYPKQVERFGVVGLHGEDLPVKRLGLRQPPGLVVLERKVEGLLDGHHLAVSFSHHCRHMAR